MANYLIVVDMQKDFVDGALGTKEAAAIVPAVVDRIKKAKENGERVIFTRDTHQDDYLETQEGRSLPVKHCIQGTDGWRFIPQVNEYVELAFNKPTFGSPALGRYLTEQGDVDRVTLIGLCTDICVISNALLIKAFLPEVPVIVEQNCCAGVTPESHENALKAMQCCQIIIK